MNKVKHERKYAGSYQSQGDQIDFLGDVVAGRTLPGGIVSMFVGKNKRDSAFSSWGVIRRDDFAFFKSGASEVAAVNLSGVEPTWSWSTPSGVFTGLSNNGERVLGGEVLSSEPADLNGSEWVMNFNSFTGVDNFGTNHENPEQSSCGESVADANPAVSHKPSVEETNRNTESDENCNRQISPTTSGAINVIIGHVSNTTSTLLEKSEYLLAKKGN